MPVRRTVRQAKKELSTTINKAGEFFLDRFPARMGNYAGDVAVPGTESKSYVRLEANGQVVEVFNYMAPNIYNWAVYVGRDKSQPGILKITEVRWLYNLSETVAYVLFHHKQHEYPAPDTVWIQRDQFMPLLVLPNGGFNVTLFGDMIYKFGMDHPIKVDDAVLDLSSYVTSTGGYYVLLEVTTDGTLNYIQSDDYGSYVAALMSPIPQPSPGAFPICAFVFFEGQTELRRDSTERSIIDLRMFTSEVGEIQIVSWGDIVGTVSDQTDLQAELDGKSDTDHTHELSISEHEHAQARWSGEEAQTVFDLPDFALQLESVHINGIEEDPLYYTLSADGSQITLDEALPEDSLVTAAYIPELT